MVKSPKDNAPIPLLLSCPCCGARHVDKGDFATRIHHSHACQVCGMVWRPAIEPTVGVRFLPGFKNPRSKSR
jgi:rubredoxin